MPARSLRTLVPALVAAALAAVAGCALPPAPLRGGPFAPLEPSEAAQGATATEPVRWGGVIVENRPARDRTCFLVLGMALDDTARPRHRDESEGRFLACAQGFFDPEVYAPDRHVTVVGWLDGTSPEKIGGYEYQAPLVEAYTVYLWPHRERAYAWGPYPYWGFGPGVWVGPGWYPWGPYPYFYRPWYW
jgi:outer membrane lipoprotein